MKKKEIGAIHQEKSAKTISDSMDGSLHLWTDRSEYKIGDELTIFIEVMKSMYVRLGVRCHQIYFC